MHGFRRVIVSLALTTTKGHMKKIVNQMRFHHFIRGKNESEGVNKIYFKRSIVYGSELLLSEYGRPQVSFKSKRNSYTRRKTGERRDDSIQRTREMIYRILRANLDYGYGYKPVFVTFTYGRNEEDINIAYKDFSYAMKKLSRKLGYRAKYLSVLEFQKRGAVHFHTIFFDIPFIPDSERIFIYRPELKNMSFVSFYWTDIWRHGNITSRSLVGVKNIASYVTKYLTKETLDSRLFGQKVYTSSRGLIRPVYEYDETIIDEQMDKGNFQIISKTNNHQTGDKHILYENISID
jgi:hypothetical protein